MQPFTSVRGRAASLPRPNVDTDIIIRIERLADDRRDRLGTYAFEGLRYLTDGTEDAEFPLNRPELRDAPTLVAGANFGCGSSREGAVWALMAMGYRCVIAPSFGDIFFNNCFENGVLPIVLDDAKLSAVRRAAEAGATVTVDLRAQTIAWENGAHVGFETDRMSRASLLAGLDSIGLTLAERDRIDAWEAGDRAARPWIWNVPTGASFTISRKE